MLLPREEVHLRVHAAGWQAHASAVRGTRGAVSRDAREMSRLPPPRARAAGAACGAGCCAHAHLCDVDDVMVVRVQQLAEHRATGILRGGGEVGRGMAGRGCGAATGATANRTGPCRPAAEKREVSSPAIPAPRSTSFTGAGKPPPRSCAAGARAAAAAARRRRPPRTCSTFVSCSLSRPLVQSSSSVRGANPGSGDAIAESGPRSQRTRWPPALMTLTLHYTRLEFCRRGRAQCPATSIPWDSPWQFSRRHTGGSLC